MKTKKTKLSIAALIMTIIALSSIAFAAFARSTNPNQLYGAPAYVLNIIGKKDSWSGGGTYDNPDRHTMFVPQTTAAASNVTIWMTQGIDFAVLDGNAFNDGDCRFQLGPGKYAVFIVALGKPGGDANVQGWIYNATDNTYLLQVGSVTVKGHSGKPQWTNATDLFWVGSGTDPFGLVPAGTSMWVFDYITALQNSSTGTYMYLWSLMTNNDKLLQVRFYQIG